MTLSKILNKLLETLRVRIPVIGLEVSDSALRCSVPGPRGWEVYAQRLENGVLEDGVIKDHAKFSLALSSLRGLLNTRYGSKKIPVVVSFSSSQIYTQAFPLPVVHVEETEKAIALNLKMISPLNYDDVYVGWQYLRNDEVNGRAEILGAFLRKSIAEELNQALEVINLRPLVLEPRSLSLARFIVQTAPEFISDTPSVVLSVDDEGLNFVVLKRGKPYFEYTELWKNLYDPGRPVTPGEFQAAIKRSVQQLVNFYSQRWPESFNQFLVVASDLTDEVKRILRDDFSFTTKELSSPPGQRLGSEWFASIGAAWRGFAIGKDDQELSLLGRTAEQKFRRERLVDSLSFWSVVVPVTLTFILLGVFSVELFIIREGRRSESQSVSQLSAEDQTALNDLIDRANRFNASVSLIERVRSSTNFKTPLITDIFSQASSSGVEIVNLQLGADGIITLNGRALSEEKIIQFKNVLRSRGYENVNLPLSNILKDGLNYFFSMTFSRIPSKTP